MVPEGAEAMRKYVETALSLRDAGGAVPFATTRLADGRIVGSTRFANLEYWAWPGGARAPPEPPDAVEIGWTWLAADAQRTAINTEAKLLMLGHAFEQWRGRRGEPRPPSRTTTSRPPTARVGARRYASASA